MHHERILRIIDDLTEPGREVDEFSVAVACGIIPAKLPRHAWVHHPARGELLQIITNLEGEKLIYSTKRGYWGMYITKLGRRTLAALAATPQSAITLDTLEVLPPQPEVLAEEALATPRAAALPFTRGHDHFYSTLALAIAGLGALLIFAFGQSAYSPLARDSAAASIGTAATPSTPLVLPLATPVTPTPTAAPTAQAIKVYVVANTGGEGVFLRQAPQTGAKLSAWAEKTTLEEIGPAQQLGGTEWLHVRAPDGGEGYVPAQYTAPTP
jgi:hypothetical protein